MADKVEFSMQVDSNIKKQCEELYEELGMDLSTAIQVFLRQSIRTGGLPFELKLEKPPAYTLDAAWEAERIANSTSLHHYSDIEEALRELK